MKHITAEEARILSRDRIAIIKKGFIEEHEKLISDILTLINDSCNNLKYDCKVILPRDKITYLESEILRIILTEWGYKVDIDPSYVASYAFEISWSNE